jgi:hypothetical protein
MLRFKRKVNAKKNEAKRPKSKPFFMILHMPSPNGMQRFSFGVLYHTSLKRARKKEATKPLLDKFYD